MSNLDSVRDIDEEYVKRCHSNVEAGYTFHTHKGNRIK